MLVYSTIASLDGYTADAEGKFDWAEPDAEVHAYINDLERGVGTYLYGRNHALLGDRPPSAVAGNVRPVVM
ncbi:dihydrofolate reductase family protein [Actinomadura sp. BRA 177]|uniref:dihydrofolate reductase family protein n=1 Tax=Actinomadura sp. BRA 177 TaxID=2745202 RepID=UPI001C3E4FC6|nr:dihydrofolate reductase family protein [Actinomadura sp. BRA 177]